MRRPLKRALAVAGLLALSGPAVVGWSVAFHLGADDHHRDGSSHHGGVVAFETALHGHTHDERTPAHGHPLLTSGAALIPGKFLLLIGAMVGDAPEVVVAPSCGRRLLAQGGPTHDPPRRLEAASVLRI